MRPGFSLWLDALRVLAAVMVLLGHVAHLRFTDGVLYGLRTWNIASDFVVVFFVLSGVVIAYASERDGTLSRFAFNRLTRLWTVLLPAILLTIVLDRIGYAADPTAYPRDYYQSLPVGEMLLRGLTFSVEWTGALDRLRLGTNGPIWSLSYEAGFYALWGAFVFLRGPLRWISLLGIAAIVGLPILIMMPAWLLGVAVWRHIKSGASISTNLAWVLFLGAPLLAVQAKIVGLHDLFYVLTFLATQPEHPLTALSYSDEVLWNSLLAVLVAAHLIGAYHLAPIISKVTSDLSARAIRWMAGASFTLYVVHYPVLHIADALLPEDIAFKPLVFILLPLLVAVIFAELFERPLPKFRSMLRAGTKKSPGPTTEAPLNLKLKSETSR